MLDQEQEGEDEHDDVIETITLALNVDPSNKRMKFRLLYQRGISSFNLQDFKSALSDFSEALIIDEKDVEVSSHIFYLRANIHFELDEYEFCCIDAEEGLKLKNCEELKELLAEAKVLLKTTKIRNPFDVLEISKTANSEEVKKAFRRLSLLYHSDKHPNAIAADKKKLGKKFQELKDAYDIIMR